MASTTSARTSSYSDALGRRQSTGTTGKNGVACQKSTKKAVLDFLTLRDPSTQALEEFASQQARLAAEKARSQRRNSSGPEQVSSSGYSVARAPSHRQRPAIPSSSRRPTAPPAGTQYAMNPARTSTLQPIRRISAVPSLESDDGTSITSRGTSPLSPPTEDDAPVAIYPYRPNIVQGESIPKAGKEERYAPVISFQPTQIRNKEVSPWEMFDPPESPVSKRGSESSQGSRKAGGKGKTLGRPFGGGKRS